MNTDTGAMRRLTPDELKADLETREARLRDAGEVELTPEQAAELEPMEAPARVDWWRRFGVRGAAGKDRSGASQGHAAKAKARRRRQRKAGR